MHDDLARVPGMERIASALKTTLDEISQSQKAAALGAHLAQNHANGNVQPFTAQFVPRQVR